MVKGELKSLRITLEATDDGVLGYVYLRDPDAAGVEETVEVAPNVMADYDSSGILVGIEFLDASRVFQDVEETLYYDPCHFNEEGNLILAEAIAPAFLAVIRE